MTGGRAADADFKGRVDSIAIVTQTVEGEQMFVVRIPVSGEDENLKPGMTGWADLRRQTAHHQDRYSPDIALVKTEFLPLLP